MSYLAHSARNGCPEQTYKAHVENTLRNSAQYAEDAAMYATLDGELLKESVRTAAVVHDMGKLNIENQEALQKKNNPASLPIHHQDAGVAFLKKLEADYFYCQLVVGAHHSGLPNLPTEMGKGEASFRDDDSRVCSKVNEEIESLSGLHHEITGIDIWPLQTCTAQGDEPIFIRMVLSCLADADHTDTAQHYERMSKEQEEQVPELRARERLAKLDAYVAQLGDESERSMLRREMYEVCRNFSDKGNIMSCDSPVGSAKTTALMACALQRAISSGARRIFVVLPFTNIINQSVEVYRNALVLPGETPESVVAELHHRADFESEDVRALTAQWKAPIIVTTAVAFFETLASRMPSALRRLHQLPGSVIFVDEAHAALPVKLLPVAWHWMQALADEWSCQWILASGSLVKFWEIETLFQTQRAVPRIVDPRLREKLMGYEANRIKFCYESQPQSREELVKWVAASPGPRLLIMNTVKNAAVVAQDLQNTYDQEQKSKVMHLSTALSPQDREKTIQAVKLRLGSREDNDWTLVATSCVEAGVNFSFKTGFREIGSLLSLLQTAGRINRAGGDEDSEIWSFMMKENKQLTQNMGIKDAIYVLNRYFQCGTTICPELSTDSIEGELERGTADEHARRLLEEEYDCRFLEVQKDFRVIDEDSMLVIADAELKEQLSRGQRDWRAIQRKAISVSTEWIGKLGLDQLVDGIYDWTLEYDDFLGIMKGLLGKK